MRGYKGHDCRKLLRVLLIVIMDYRLCINNRLILMTIVLLLIDALYLLGECTYV